METNREKAVPVLIRECVKAGADLAEQIAAIQTSLGAGLAPECPSPAVDCKEVAEGACEYVKQLREHLTTLHRANEKAKSILDRLEV